MLEEIKPECPDDNLWYKLYADDLVLVASAQQLENLLETIRNVFSRYKLTINANKYVDVVIKRHTKLYKLDLRGIAIVQEY
jgi:hypothetical protein